MCRRFGGLKVQFVSVGWETGAKLGFSKFLISKDRVRTLSIDTSVAPVSSGIKDGAHRSTCILH